MPSGPKRLVVEENRPRAAWLACCDARRKPGPHTRSRVGGCDVWIEKSAFLSPFVSPRTTISLPTPWQRSSLIVEEALEGEVSDVVEPERYERAEAAAGYRICYRPSTIKRRQEGMVDYAASQVRDTPEPFVSAIRAVLGGRPD